MGYEYKIEQVLKGSKTFSHSDLAAIPDTISQITSEYQTHFLPELSAKLFQEQGISTLDSELTLLNVAVEEVGGGQLVFKIKMHYRIVTDKPCHKFGSLPIWTVRIIAYAVKIVLWIALIYVGAWALTRIIDGLKSLTTTTNISWIHDDDPDSPNYCRWFEIRTEREKWDWVIYAILFVIALMVIYGVIGKGALGGTTRRKRRKKK